MEEMLIKDAAKHLGIEAHVLRYWEEELGLLIKRNKMGHRYYDEKDIHLFEEIIKLRDEGFPLKDIKAGIDKKRQENIKDNIMDSVKDNGEEIGKNNDEEKKINFDFELEEIKRREPNCNISSLDDENAATTCDSPSGEVKVVDFKIAQLQMLMNKVVANALKENKGIITNSFKAEITENVIKQMDIAIREKEERDEQRFKRLDDYMRQMQRVNEEVAATRNRKLFKKRRH